jgi:hypothetical protein
LFVFRFVVFGFRTSILRGVKQLLPPYAALVYGVSGRSYNRPVQIGHRKVHLTAVMPPLLWRLEKVTGSFRIPRSTRAARADQWLC